MPDRTEFTDGLTRKAPNADRQEKIYYPGDNRIWQLFMEIATLVDGGRFAKCRKEVNKMEIFEGDKGHD